MPDGRPNERPRQPVFRQEEAYFNRTSDRPAKPIGRGLTPPVSDALFPMPKPRGHVSCLVVDMRRRLPHRGRLAATSGRSPGPLGRRLNVGVAAGSGHRARVTAARPRHVLAVQSRPAYCCNVPFHEIGIASVNVSSAGMVEARADELGISAFAAG